MSETGGLAEFIAARLDEDEAVAETASGPAWKEAERASCDCCAAVRTVTGALVATPDDRDAPHIARHDPARVLRDVAAKRAIVARHVPIDDLEPPQCLICLEYEPCRTLRLLAAVHSDHPDYRTEWKP